MKIKNLIYTILLIVFFISTSCNKLDGNKGYKKFPEQIIGTGEIIPNAMINYGTSTNSKSSGGERIITSDSLNVHSLVVSFDGGASYIPIDFSQYSILGKYAEGDSRVVFERNVTKSIEKQKYIYKIRVIQCGSWLTYNASLNYVLIPKMEDNFSVEFIVEHVQWNNGRTKIIER